MIQFVVMGYMKESTTVVKLTDLYTVYTYSLDPEITTPRPPRNLIMSTLTKQISDRKLSVFDRAI